MFKILSFNFGGKNSYDDFGVLISKRPSIPSPKRRVSFIDVPGRDSALRLDEKTYEDITVTAECYIKDSENVSDKIDNIKAWLLNSNESDLIFSFQKDKKYIAQVVNIIDFKQINKVIGSFPIVFNCRPFKYAVKNNAIALLKSGEIVDNPGTIAAEPVITVYGTGNIELSVSGKTVKLYNLSDYLVLDTMLLECYRNSEVKNSDMVGNFPELKTGGNVISWTGSISRIEIIPNFRWL